MVELILELCSKIDHESIGGTGLNGSSVGGLGIGEIEGLHSGWILNELVHETNVMESTCVDVVIDLLGDGRVIQTKRVNWELREGHYNEYNGHDNYAAETATNAGC